MKKKDYCQLQFGVILSCLICLSQAHTVLNSTSEERTPSASEYDPYLQEDYALPEGNVLENSVYPEEEIEEHSMLEEIFENCHPPTIKCIKNTVMHRLQDLIEHTREIPVTSFMSLIKKERSNLSEIFDEVSNEYKVSESRGFINTAVDLLNIKATKFFMNHNMEVRIPKYLMDNINVTISDYGVEGDDAVLTFEMIPRFFGEDAEPKIFKKKIKKAIKKGILAAVIAVLLIAKKWFTNKLGMILGALMVVLALIKTLVMFVLPAILGVATAKKFLLKMLLFVFPFLTHIFKLCPYYPQGTKYHHHHHQIAHYHNVHVPSVELDHPPPGWHGHHDDDFSYYSDGAGFGGYEYGGHRKNDYKHQRYDKKEVDTWSKGQGQLSSERYPAKVNKVPTPTEIENLVLKAEKEALLKARLQEEQKRVHAENKRLQEQLLMAKKIQEKLKLQALLTGKKTPFLGALPNKIVPDMSFNVPPSNLGLGLTAPTAPHLPQSLGLHGPPLTSTGHHLTPLHGNLGFQPSIHHPTAGNNLQFTIPNQVFQPPIGGHPSAVQQEVSNIASRIRDGNVQKQMQTVKQNQLVAQQSVQNSVKTNQVPRHQDPMIIDPFYSPILEKIDKVLNNLGYEDEGCRDRLICSMYKNPTKFSPHSNLLSAELSRDASELQKPTSSNAAVIRFYKYVQAARDGQDKRDCIRLYAACAINTEK